MAKDPKTGQRIRDRPGVPGDDVEQARVALLARANREEPRYIGWLVVYAVDRRAGELDAHFLYCYEEWYGAQSGSDWGWQIVKSGRATVRGSDVVSWETRDEGRADFGEWEHDYGDWDSDDLPGRVRTRLEAEHAARVANP